MGATGGINPAGVRGRINVGEAQCKGFKAKNYRSDEGARMNFLLALYIECRHL